MRLFIGFVFLSAGSSLFLSGCSLKPDHPVAVPIESKSGAVGTASSHSQAPKPHHIEVKKAPDVDAIEMAKSDFDSSGTVSEFADYLDKLHQRTGEPRHKVEEILLGGYMAINIRGTQETLKAFCDHIIGLVPKNNHHRIDLDKLAVRYVLKRTKNSDYDARAKNSDNDAQ